MVSEVPEVFVFCSILKMMSRATFWKCESACGRSKAVLAFGTSRTLPACFLPTSLWSAREATESSTDRKRSARPLTQSPSGQLSNFKRCNIKNTGEPPPLYLHTSQPRCANDRRSPDTHKDRHTLLVQLRQPSEVPCTPKGLVLSNHPYVCLQRSISTWFRGWRFSASKKTKLPRSRRAVKICIRLWTLSLQIANPLLFLFYFI